MINSKVFSGVFVTIFILLLSLFPLYALSLDWAMPMVVALCLLFGFDFVAQENQQGLLWPAISSSRKDQLVFLCAMSCFWIIVSWPEYIKSQSILLKVLAIGVGLFIWHLCITLFMSQRAKQMLTKHLKRG